MGQCLQFVLALSRSCVSYLCDLSVGLPHLQFVLHILATKSLQEVSWHTVRKGWPLHKEPVMGTLRRLSKRRAKTWPQANLLPQLPSVSSMALPGGSTVWQDSTSVRAGFWTMPFPWQCCGIPHTRVLWVQQHNWKLVIPNFPHWDVMMKAGLQILEKVWTS